MNTQYHCKLLQLSIILLLISCNNQNSENLESDLVSENLKGKVKSYTEATYYAREEFGEIIKSKYPKIDEYFKKEFNKYGNIIYKTYYNRSGEEIKKTVNEYDENQNLIYRYDINTNKNKTTPIEKIKYDEDQNLIERVKFFKSGKIWFKNLNEYDENGNVVIESKFDSDDNLKKKRIYTYKDKRKIYYINYDKNGDPTSKTEYIYDEKGIKILETTKWYSDGDISKDFFDEDGNKIRYIGYYSNGSIRKKMEFEYDKDGNQTAIIHYDEDGTTTKITYEYDENGNEMYKENNYLGSIIRQDYDQYGNLIYYEFNYLDYDDQRIADYKYEYDKHFNWVLQTKTSEVYKPEIKERTYEYYD